MKKSAFTLAEVTITLVILGTISALTIPAVQKYIMDARCRASYKKAYSNVQSILAAQISAGNIRHNGGAEENIAVFEALMSNFHVKEFASNDVDKLDNGEIYGTNDYKTALEYTDSQNRTIKIGSGDTLSISLDWASDPSPWLITEDNMAYSIIAASSSTCYAKETLNGISGSNSASLLKEKSCAIVVVDINGLSKGPNKIETQVLDGINEDDILNTIKGDRFYIYVATNGTAQGPKKTSFSGRLLADLK